MKKSDYTLFMSVNEEGIAVAKVLEDANVTFITIYKTDDYTPRVHSNTNKLELKGLEEIENYFN
jgi:hypothetical protein